MNKPMTTLRSAILGVSTGHHPGLPPGLGGLDRRAVATVGFASLLADATGAEGCGAI